MCVNVFVFCPSAAPVPVRGAEEAAGSGHRPHHPAGQQLVSLFALHSSFVWEAPASPRQPQANDLNDSSGVALSPNIPHLQLLRGGGG